MALELLLPPDVATRAVRVVGFVPSCCENAPIRWTLLGGRARDYHLDRQCAVVWLGWAGLLRA